MAESSLRPRTLAANSIAMSVRQAVGAVLGIGGTIIVTRIIGPSTYGLFASVLAIQSYVGSLSNSGIEVSLMRSQRDDHEKQDRQGLALVLGISLVGALLCLLSLPLLSRWIAAPRILGVGFLVFISLPLSVIWIVPRARLSRRMAFGRIAVVEVIAQSCGVIVSLVLAVMKFGVWAPALGWFCQSLLLTLLYFREGGLWPAFDGSARDIKSLIGDAWSFSASSLVWQSKSLLNPLVVGHYLGTESVGYVALCARIIETLSFVRNATWHMMIVSFAKLVGERERLSSYLTRAGELQLLAVAPLFLGFALTAPIVFPALMGIAWQPVLRVFPFVACGAIATSVTSPAVAALYALGADARVFTIRVVQVMAVALTAWVLVPRIGLLGYAWGELTVFGTAALFELVISNYADMNRRLVLAAWCLAAAALLFYEFLGSAVCLAPLLALIVPGSWHALTEHRRFLSSHLLRARSRSELA